MRRWLGSIAAAATVVLASLGFLLGGGAAASATPSITTYTANFAYDCPVVPSATLTATTERGPPAAHDHTPIAYHADGLRPLGALARSDGPAPLTVTTYCDPTGPAQVARAKRTTREQVRRSDGGLSSLAGSDVAANGVPTVTFSRSRAPGIAQNFDNAVANGAPTSLTRVGDATRKANRRAALRGQPRAPAGQSLDEYPFACSAQGGCGSFVRSVPVGEQNYQGGVLSRFFQDYGVNPGDPFNVMFGP